MQTRQTKNSFASPKSFQEKGPTYFQLATLKTREKLGQVNTHKDFWDCYWGQGKELKSASPKTIPEIFAKANLAQFPSRFRVSVLAWVELCQTAYLEKKFDPVACAASSTTPTHSHAHNLKISKRWPL